MPKPNNFLYKKKSPFRDAFFFIIVREGQNREPDYFGFFIGISSRVKIVPVNNAGSSAPKNLIGCAVSKEAELDVRAERGDQVWFVIDTDKWKGQLHEISEECEAHPHWRVAQSNPCFEVWLYFHAKAQLPDLPNIDQCNNWKQHLPSVIDGGFNSDFHPIAIETAILHSKASYSATGYFPEPGSTQLWQLGEGLLPLMKKDLDAQKHTFPYPTVKG